MVPVGGFSDVLIALGSNRFFHILLNVKFLHDVTWKCTHDSAPGNDLLFMEVTCRSGIALIALHYPHLGLLR